MPRTTLKTIKYIQIEQEDQTINITGNQHDPEEPTNNLIISITLHLSITLHTPIKFKTPHKGCMTSRIIYDLTNHSNHPYWYQTGQMDMLEQGTTYSIYFLRPMLPEDEPLIQELFAEHS